MKAFTWTWQYGCGNIIMIITIALLFILITMCFHIYIHYITRNGRLINNIPGPTVYPIIGNIFQFLGSREEQWKVLINLIDQYNPICKFWAFFLPVVFIRHPDDLQTILKDTNHIEKSLIYDVLQPWLGTGLFTAKATKWRVQRKKIVFTFRLSTISQYVPMMIKHSENMIKSLKNTESTDVEDLMSFVAEHTLNILCETLMGVPLEDLSGFQQQYRKAINHIIEICVYRLVRQWLHNDWIFSLTSKGKEHARILKTLHEFTERIIAERKLRRKRNHKQNSGQVLENNSETEARDAIGTQEKEPQTLIDLLIDESEKNGTLTDLNIREEIDTFMFGGYDTASVSISYLLMLLAEHEDIQDRVRNEVDTVMKENDGKLTTESLKNLVYLERCIKESLRLYPVAFLISRITGKDVNLQSYLVPAGTILILNIYGVHRDPNFWPNPEKFDPDRFLPGKARKDNAYIPFSSGLRSCIGKQFALNVIKATTAFLVHHFYCEPIDYLKNLRLQTHLTLHPSHPLRIRFIWSNACWSCCRSSGPIAALALIASPSGNIATAHGGLGSIVRGNASGHW